MGLAVTVGGLFTPVLGTLADARGLHFTLMALVGLPAVALLLSAFLRAPAPAGPVRAAVPGPAGTPAP